MYAISQKGCGRPQRSAQSVAFSIDPPTFSIDPPRGGRHQRIELHVVLHTESSRHMRHASLYPGSAAILA